MRISSRIDAVDAWICNEVLPDISDQAMGLLEKVVELEDKAISRLVSTQLMTNGLCILDTHMVFNTNVRDFFEVEGDHIILGFMFRGKAIADIHSLENQKEYASNLHNIRYSPRLQAVFEMPPLVDFNYFLVIMSKEYYFRVIHRDSTLHYDFAQQILLSHQGYLNHHEMLITPEIRRVIHEIRECRKQAEFKRLFIEAKVIELLMLQLEQIHDLNTRPTQSFLRGDDRNKLEQAKTILEAAYKQAPGLQELSKMVYLNEFKLKQGFKELYGITVYGYVIRLRMEKAKQLILEGHLSIGEIALEIGYKNSAHFSAAYKKYFGLVPSEYRKEHV